jgi:death-on-curing protein
VTRPVPRWLPRLVVDSIHAELLREHGGSPGLRDENLLESALARPRHLFAYQTNVDTVDLAAAYGYGIARNHPFDDGNKRTALMAMYVFLGLNGWSLEADEAEAARTILALAAGELTEGGLSKWLRTNAHRRERPPRRRPKPSAARTPR